MRFIFFCSGVSEVLDSSSSGVLSLAGSFDMAVISCFLHIQTLCEIRTADSDVRHNALAHLWVASESLLLLWRRSSSLHPMKHACSLHWSCFCGFGILRWVNHGHAGRALLAGHRIAPSRLAIQGQAQNLAQWLVRILSRCHALPIANGQE